MNSTCELSNVTQNYLNDFHTILDTMMEQMTNACLKDSISYNFIVQMIPHHEAAIKMSENLLKYTTCIPLQNIALAIISEQTKSIEDMKNIVCTCKNVRNTHQNLWNYQTRLNRIMNTMFTDMGSACKENDINTDFMQEMIPHHKGAIEMSQTTLAYPICPELKPVLRAIITSQKQGVREMHQLLCCSKL